MKQISELEYMKNKLYWDAVGRQCGGLEICSDYNGQPIYAIWY